jgi:hypothetical protein
MVSQHGCRFPHWETLTKNSSGTKGEIYRMRFPGNSFIIANSYAMVNEFCDEKRFPKTISALKVDTNKLLRNT